MFPERLSWRAPSGLLAVINWRFPCWIWKLRHLAGTRPWHLGQLNNSQTSKFSMTSSVVFCCEYALYEWCTMVGFGAFPCTRMVYIRSVGSMQFLTIPSLKLDKCILSKFEKDRKLFRNNLGELRKSQKLESEALPSIISGGQKATTMAVWQISKPCFTQSLSTLDCHASNYQENHTESRIIRKSY